MNQPTFKDLGLMGPLLKALEKKGYTHPSPIQAQAIPKLLRGEDLLGCAQTGTGKTAAFALPILQQMFQRGPYKGPRHIKALVVTPTRELAIQIDDNFSLYGHFTGLRNAVIFGGVNQRPQVSTLRRGVDILVATPGRLLDLINQGFITLKHVEYVVLDEADHMLDMGFIHDIKKIIAQLPPQRQSLFFSATMPPNIETLANSFLRQPSKISIAPQTTTAQRVEQSLYYVSKSHKPALLAHVLQQPEVKSAIVFSRTKHGANKIVAKLDQAGIKAAAIHGNKTQAARQKALKIFKEGKLTALVATDIAARGIDVNELSHVVNYDLPNVPETYVHRIGRTGRASASGRALSFCCAEEKKDLRSIERLINQSIPVMADHPFAHEPEAPAPAAHRAPKKHTHDQKASSPRRRSWPKRGRR